MNLWRLIIKEILHRRLSFLLAVLGVAAACGTLAAETTLLKAHGINSLRSLARDERLARERLAVLEDDYRKITIELGFNVLVLPEGQEIGDFWDKGFASKTMPEEYVQRLVDSKITLLQHLVPILERKVAWPEQKRTIILAGTRGEASLTARKKPMQASVDAGRVILGHELWSSLGLKAGDKVTIMGAEMVVSRCAEERGSADDITAWVDLAVAQQMLNEPGRINAIEALKCHCQGNDIESVRREIATILPGTQVKEIANLATVRGAARDRAAAEHRQALQQQLQSQAMQNRQREQFASVLAPLVIVASALWTGLLALLNVRQRAGEIGILRAIGLSSRRIFGVFLVKAGLVGLLGSSIGLVAGLGVAAGWAARDGVAASDLWWSWPIVALTILGAMMVACLASWPPAVLAARQDPAAILSRE